MSQLIYPSFQSFVFCLCQLKFSSDLFSLSIICVLPVYYLGGTEVEMPKGKLRTKRGKCGGEGSEKDEDVRLEKRREDLPP